MWINWCPTTLIFGERLHSWIDTDHPTQYRDQEAQTSKPVLQDQPVTVVDIQPQITDPNPESEPTEPHPDALSPVQEPVGTSKANTTETRRKQSSPRSAGNTVRFDPCPDQESPAGLSNGPDTEAAPMLRPEDVSDQLHPVPTDSKGPDVDPADGVEPADP